MKNLDPVVNVITMRRGSPLTLARAPEASAGGKIQIAGHQSLQRESTAA